MQQYEYTLTHKTTGRVEHARATAATAAIARAQIMLTYGRAYTVTKEPTSTAPAHYILGEIDCSDFPLRDLPWLMREAASI